MQIVYSLLSLDLSPVKEILVDFCAGGKQGYQTLLNLRLVCKTTKNWVESLPPAISRRIFQDVILHVEVTRQNLSHYLESPFSSIRIPNLYCEEREESFDIDILENEKDVQLIMNFVSIWKPRIESMEQIYCPLPLLPIMANLPKLRSYQCHQLFTNISDNEYEVSSLFENFPFGIERLSITHVYLNPPQKKAFYDNLIANAATLKYFGTAPFYNDFDDIFSPPSHRYPEDLPGTIQCLRQLLETKKYDPDFTLVLNFKGYSREISNEHKTALLDSVKSLLSSASNIQLHSFPEEYLQEVERVLEDDQVQKLCNLVYSVPHVLMYPHLFMKYRFPNLNQIGLTLLIGTVAGDLRSLPNLTQLGVFAPSDWAPNWPRLLVPNLTELQICTRELQWFGKASIMEPVKLLSAVSECCPVLETLILNYEITSNEIPPLEDINHVSLQKTSWLKICLSIFIQSSTWFDLKLHLNHL